MNQQTRQYIAAHRTDDVRQLALQAPRHTEVDMPVALEQIAGWQTARRKIPTWAAKEGVVYGPHLNMEQCSSEATARYKAAVAERLLRPVAAGNEEKVRMADLTGGMGVDFSFLSPLFDESFYIERDAHLCDLMRQNQVVLALKGAQVVEGDGREMIQRLPPLHLIYIDPARRNRHGARTYAIGDCTPNVLEMEEELTAKARWVMVKLSPMLDWHKAVADLNRRADVVREVHIVSTGNECKELLLVLSARSQEPMEVCCVNDGQTFRHIPGTEETIFPKFSQNGNSEPFHREKEAPKANETYANTLFTHFTRLYLFEPNSSVMKAGCFDALQRRYDVTALGRNSHLFVSSELIEDFPGRKFLILSVSPFGKQGIKAVQAATDRGNVAVRNFPLSADQLRQRLKLKDGGESYIFGTTIDEASLAEALGAKAGHVVVIAKKT